MMTQWYVKELSTLTHVSVQTLHHYDRIGLLTPSIRLANQYRVYSERDVSKLQQILALKFFGFTLSEIKAMLKNEMEVHKHLSAQAQYLEQKAHMLLDTSKALKSIMSDVADDISIPWETMIQLIEVYRMTQELEHVWVKEIFTPAELKQYAEMKLHFTAEKKATFEKNWSHLVEEIQSNLAQDPQSKTGAYLGEKCMSLINGLYGKKYAHLRTTIFEKGFGEGKGLAEAGLTADMVSWLDQAIDAYWRQRIYSILAQVGNTSSSEVLDVWNTLLDEMYGEDTARQQAIFDIVLHDEQISSDAKKWLQGLPTP